MISDIKTVQCKSEEQRTCLPVELGNVGTCEFDMTRDDDVETSSTCDILNKLADDPDSS
jgi:hypothetical protein